MDPILDTNMAAPRPWNLVSVGRSSTMYRYTTWYAMLMVSLPAIAKVTMSHWISVMKCFLDSMVS